MKMTKEVRDALSHILSYDFEDEYFKVGVELIVQELSHIMMNAEIKEYEDGAELRKKIEELRKENLFLIYIGKMLNDEGRSIYHRELFE